MPEFFRLQLTNVVVRAVVVATVSTSLLFASPTTSLGADWYEGAEHGCSGDPAMIAAFVALLPPTMPIHNGSRGNLFLEAKISVINSLEGSGGENVIDRLTLNQALANDYRTAVQNIAAARKIPYFVDVGSAVFAGLAFSAQLGTGLGLVFSYLLEELKKPSSDLSGLAAFIARGGELNRRWKVLVDDANGFYLVSGLEYVVSVGQEARRFVTAGCAYPVKVVVSEFRTNEAFSNKIIKPNGNAWGIFDIEDNKWDSPVLKYTGQDQEFLYFNEDAIENDNVMGQHVHKLSFRGGRWQFKNFFDGPNGTFKNLSGPLSAF